MESFISSIPHLISEFTSELEMGRRIVTLAKRRRIELENLSTNRRQNQKEKQDEFEEEVVGGDVSVVDQAISVLLISKEIFSHLSYEDLLNCSLVNKTWNFSARYELREEDRKCFACIGGDKPCQSLNDFIAVVKKSWNLPFNGLSFNNTAYSGTSSTSSSSSETSDSESSDKKDGYGDPDKHLCVATVKKRSSKRNSHISAKFQSVLSAFKIKHLRLSWEKEPKLDCPAMKLIHHIVTEGSKDLVGLTVDQLPRSATEVSKYFGFLPKPKPKVVVFHSDDEESEDRTVAVEDDAPKWLPNVRVLYLPNKRWSWGWESNPIPIVRDLILAIPRLESIQGYVSLEFLPTILKLKKNYCVHHFAFELIKFRYGTLFMNQNNSADFDSPIEDYDINQLLQFGLTFAQEKPKLRKLMISTSFSALTIFQAEALNQLKSNVSMIASQVLKSSCDVLTELWINHLDLVLLATHLPPLAPVDASNSFRLTRLKHVTVELHEEIDARLGFSSIYRIDFATIFPRLESIQIRCRRYFMMRDDVHPYITPSFRQLNSNYMCETVKKLSIGGEFKGLNATTFIGDCAKLFPNVKSFEADMYECECFEECCLSIWSAWPELESLRFHGVRDALIKTNLDPTFTGLERQDCDRLFYAKKWNFNAFKKLQVRPSLLNLTKLKQLQVEIHHVDDCERSNTLNKVFLSELTGQCVLKRMPELVVEIERYTCDCVADSKSTKCRFELNHLKPFVKFVLGFED